MKQKLGPLQLWQWLAIGAALGIGTYLYRRSHPTASPSLTTPADAQYGPIDPTTGLPYAGSAGGSGDASSGAVAAPGDLPTLLQNFQSLEDLFAGLQSLGAGPGPATETAGAAVSTATGAAPKPKKPPAKTSTAHLLSELKHPAGHSAAHLAHVKTILRSRGVRIPKPKKTTHGGKHNPGHHVVHHSGGKKSASSSAAHNTRQHHNVAAPEHQRHHPTKKAKPHKGKR